MLIADRDLDRAAQMMGEEGYSVTTTDSVSMMMQGILKKLKVVLLGSEVDEMPVTELIPLLKKCNKKIEIILVSGESSLPQIPKVSQRGNLLPGIKIQRPRRP